MRIGSLPHNSILPLNYKDTNLPPSLTNYVVWGGDFFECSGDIGFTVSGVSGAPNIPENSGVTAEAATNQVLGNKKRVMESGSRALGEK
eukprot:5133862-Amphidinium_carterae.1